MKTKVFIDGDKIENERAIHFTLEPGKWPGISLDFVGDNFYLDGKVVLAIPDPLESAKKQIDFDLDA